MTDLLSRLRDALADRYALEKELGRGGMATVFLAKDLRHGRRVAIKVMGHELSAQLGTERFLREIRTAAVLNHPNILPLYDSGEAVGVLYYVMPFVEGGSLRDRLSREAQLPVDEAIAIAREVADALGHAHSVGVVHRDIKPENILFLSGRPVVADFGIARAVDAAGDQFTQITQTGMAIGTPAYMSPEQAAGDAHVDGRSDIYALGCVLYEMLAGRPPFDGRNSREVMARHAMDPVPPLRPARPTVPEGIEAVITQSLAKVPADRFSTATAMSEALALGGSRQITPSSGAVRALDTRRKALGTLPRVAAAVVLLGAVAVGGYLLRGRTLDAATMEVTVIDADGNTIQRTIPRAEARRRVGIFFFDHDRNDTATAWLAYALPSAVGVDLLQNMFLDVRDPAHVRDRVRRDGFPTLTGLPNALARDIAREQFREQFLRGQVRREGGEYVVDYTLYETASGNALRQGTLRSANPLDLIDPITEAVSGTVQVPEGYRGELRDLPASELLTSSPTAFAHLGRGIQALTVADDYTAGAAHAERAVAEDPTYTIAQFQLYAVRLFQGRPQDGAAALQAAMDHIYRLPERIQNQVRSAWYEIRGEQDRAYAVIEMNAELFPTDLLALAALGQIQVLRDQRDDAIRTYERILELDPGQHDYLLVIANLHRSQGNYDAALTTLERYTDANPRDRRGFIETGDLQRERGNHGAGRDAYERGLLTNPDDVTLRLRLANIDLGLGNFAAALTTYQRTLADARNAQDSVAALGAIENYHRTRGQMRQALTVGVQGLNLQARFSAPVQTQLRTLFTLGHHIAAGDTAQAFRLLTQYGEALQPPLDAFLPLAHVSIAVELEDPVRLDSAAAGLERAIATLGIAAFQPNVVYARGLAHYLRGEYQQALERWQDEQSLNPGDWTVNRQLGQAHRGLGNHDRALALFQEALRVRPSDPLTRYQLGLLYRDMGRREDARREVQAALDVWSEADSGFKWVRRARETLQSLGR
ncbi:MAG: protein kinase [Gemmatimonadales bacterium]